MEDMVPIERYLTGVWQVGEHSCGGVRILGITKHVGCKQTLAEVRSFGTIFRDDGVVVARKNDVFILEWDDVYEVA